jgi:N-acetylglutamate synthase-like GNAT family acetyltransferase
MAITTNLRTWAQVYGCSGDAPRALRRLPSCISRRDAARYLGCLSLRGGPMPNTPDIVTLDADAQLREAIAAHVRIHGDPEPIWEEFHFRHPHWSAPGATRAVVENGQIVALTSLAMIDLRFGHTTLPAGEIGLVGTLPEHRNRGHSRRLMESWLATLRERHVPLSYLVGIPGYYERWGYHYAAPDQVNHFLAITHDPLARCAEPAGTVRDATANDIPTIQTLLDTELRDTPCSAVLDDALLRYVLDRAEAHGVAWRVIEIDGHIAAVVRYKLWGEGIGPQAPGAVTLVAARDVARPAVAAMLLEHLKAGKQAELPLAIAPYSPFADWLHLRGALRKCDRSIFPGGYAAMVRIGDLATVLEAVMHRWDADAIAGRHAGASITIRVGRDDDQVATLDVLGDGVGLRRGAGGVEIGAPPAVTVPWVTGWRAAADWLDGTPFPPVPGPEVDPGDPAGLPLEVRALLRDLFPVRHPWIGDTIQGA